MFTGFLTVPFVVAPRVTSSTATAKSHVRFLALISYYYNFVVIQRQLWPKKRDVEEHSRYKYLIFSKLQLKINVIPPPPPNKNGSGIPEDWNVQNRSDFKRKQENTHK